MFRVIRIATVAIVLGFCSLSAVYAQASFSVVSSLTDPLTGQVTVPSGSDVVTGVGTQFLSELRVGEPISIQDEIFLVEVITSDTQLTIDGFHGTGALSVVAFRSLALLRLAGAGGAEKVMVDRLGNLLVQERVAARLYCDEAGENCSPVSDLAAGRKCTQGYAGVNEELCIRSSTLSAPSPHLANAVERCASEGAHLCSFGEWLGACRLNKIPGSSPTREFVYETYLRPSDYYTVHFQPSSSSHTRCVFEVSPFSAPRNLTSYRCCHDR